MVIQTNQLIQLINSLTDDEDYRQDLWVYFLEGNSLNSFSDNLKELTKDRARYVRAQQELQNFFRVNPSPSFPDFLAKFSEFECAIMFLMMIGFKVEEIARYKSISIVRIMQAIETIRKNPAWKLLRGK